MPKKTRNKKTSHTKGKDTRQKGNASEPELRSISVEEFARRLKAETATDKRFAFFLGAGCSITSGIPSAADLVQYRWLPRLHGLQDPHRSDVDKWASEVIQGYDPANPAQSYGKLIEKLFFTAEDRQREIESLCDGCTPSFGYAVLAQLMSQPEGSFCVVLTTNFDDLIADALYLYTEVRPLVISHEYLAAFIRSTRTRPLIVKLHGDHRLSPKNTVLETEVLEREIQVRTKMVLHDRGIIFMGYGGSDRGILNLLKELPNDALPFGVFWVHPHKPNGPMLEWLLNRQGVWVHSGLFDEAMLLIRNEFDLPHPSEERFTRIFGDYNKKFQELSNSIQKKSPSEAGVQALQKALTDTEARLPDFWKILNEAYRLQYHDPVQAQKLYIDGISRFPNEAPLLGNYALFLKEIRKDYDVAEAMYKRAIEADPKSAINLGNYAIFLEKTRKDYDATEAMYKRAIEADPKNAITLGNYAVFMTNIRKDYNAAEAIYKQALEDNPKHVIILGAYANFLNNIRQDYNAAEAMYKQALEVAPKYISILGNYAIFLEEIRKDYDAAKVMFERAIEIDQKNPNTHANLARLLLAHGRTNGLVVLNKAIELLHENTIPTVELECAFYLFAHGTVENRVTALRTARKLIDQSVCSPGWNFSQNIERAKLDRHPEADWLPKLAAVINGDEIPEVLNDWPAWQKAATK